MVAGYPCALAADLGFVLPQESLLMRGYHDLVVGPTGCFDAPDERLYVDWSNEKIRQSGRGSQRSVERLTNSQSSGPQPSYHPPPIYSSQFPAQTSLP
jgi:hypothetical protein